MGRKQTPEIDSAPDSSEQAWQEAPREVSRREPRTKRAADSSRNRGGARRGILSLLRMLLGWTAGIIVTTFCIAGAFQTQQFLMHGQRFALASPEDPGLDSPGIDIQGAHFVSRSAISLLFERDYGRSLFQIPLSKRQEELQRLDWVESVSILRVWPNHLQIRLTERTPVAFVLLNAANGASHHALIDGNGEFLTQPAAKAEFHLPVVAGIGPDESPALRKRKIQRALSVLREAGPIGDKISVVDVLRLDSISVSYDAGGQGLTLLLGSDHFAQHLNSFQAYYPDIQRRYPSATRFDLRLDDRINAMDGARSGK